MRQRAITAAVLVPVLLVVLALGGVEASHALERMKAAEHLAILFQV